MDNNQPEGPNGVTRRDFIGSAAALALVLAGCGGTAAPAASSAAPSAAAAKGKRGGTLTVGTGGAKSTDTLDPNLLNSVPVSLLARSFWEQLADFDNELGYQLQLAESIEPNSSADVWTIRLKQGIEFHNGKTLGADDVIFTFNRMYTVPGAVMLGKFKGYMDPKNMTKMDDRTVRVQLSKPQATFPSALASPCKIVPVGFDVNKPVGTGPFKVNSFTPNREWVADRFANYWNAKGASQPSDTPAPAGLGDKPYVDQLVVKVINDDSARLNALVTGQVDAINLLPFAQVPTITSNKDLKLLESSTGSWTGIFMDTAQDPWKDPRVRQALRLSIDREQALQSALSGHGVVAYDLYEPYDPGYPKTLQRKRDVAQAKALLQQAGKTNVEGEIVTAPVTAAAVPLATILAQNAAEAGFNIKVRQVDLATLYGSNWHHWPLSQDAWPAQGDFLILASLLDLGGDTVTHWSDPEFSSLYQQAEATADVSKRNTIKGQMYQIIFDRGAWIIPFYTNVLNGYNVKTAGWPKNDAAGRSFGNGHFEQVYLTS